MVTLKMVQLTRFDNMIGRMAPSRIALDRHFLRPSVYLALIMGFGNPSPFQAQPPPSTEFEVASIKPSSTDGPLRLSLFTIKKSPNGITLQNVSLRDCITWAYNVQVHQISKSPFLDINNRYDILASTAGPTPTNQTRLMVQKLLAERFNLRLHHEIKSLDVYELRMGKKGPKLPAPRSDGQDHVAVSIPRFLNGSMFFDDTSMEEFADRLASLKDIGRKVIDKTEISGFYDLVLNSTSTISPDGTGISLFTAVEEQLGLKLVPAKGDVDTIVIDHAENPSEN